MNLFETYLRRRFYQVIQFAGSSLGVTFIVVALTGCMGITPSSHPRPPTPTPDVFPPPPTSLPMPSGSSAPPTPSNRNMPGQGGPSSPSPSALPSPTGSGMPGLPSLPNPSMPTSPSVLPSPSTSGMPQRPSMPSPSSGSDSQSQQRGGTNFPSVPGLPDLQTGERSRGSQADSGDGQQSDGAQQGQTGQLPSGGPLQTADGDEQNTDRDGSTEGGMADQRSGDERQSASSVGSETGVDINGLPSAGGGEQQEGGQEIEIDGDPGAGVLGTPDGNENGGWVISNELPENEKVRQGIPDPAIEEEDEEGSVTSESDQELEETLAGIDGSIMSDREEHAEKINERAGGDVLPGDAVLAEEDRSGTGGGRPPSAVGGTSKQHIPNVNHPERRSQPPDPNRPSITIGQTDIPDAKDDDVVARQLREAALAEKDPELREALWEELRRYLEKRK